jgi:CBS domain-containing protein
MIPRIASTKISDMKLREPVRLPESATLLQAVELLRERKRGVVLVEAGDGILRGVFTERDLVTRVDHTNLDWHKQKVSDCMTASPRRVGPGATIGDAVAAMKKGSFRNLPLVDKAGHATGVVTVRDILRYVAENFPQEFVNLPPDPQHEATAPWGG